MHSSPSGSFTGFLDVRTTPFSIDDHGDEDE